MPRFTRLFLSLLSVGLLTACGVAPVDLDGWRRAEAVARPLDDRGALADELAQVENLRGGRRLADARALTLALVAEHPDGGRIAFLASRAESDGLVLFADRDKEVRNAAAASALEYARRAADLGEESAEAVAQYAWALGASTHLQPMGDRAAHAQQTLDVAARALAADPAEPTALATTAVVHLRLQTLPWIARLMASGLPDSSLDAAVDFARRAATARPSRENRLILARCLRAAGDDAGATDVLEQALAAPPTYPRDELLEDDLRAELE